MRRSTTAATATRTTCVTAEEEEEERKQARRRTAAAEASMCLPSAEALAMAGSQCMPLGACCSDEGKPLRACCSDDDDDDGVPPEHLRAFEAFLEKVVPVDMIMASRREEDARLRLGGKPRSHDDDMKEKLRLWAKAVAEKTMRVGRR